MGERREGWPGACPRRGGCASVARLSCSERPGAGNLGDLGKDEVSAPLGGGHEGGRSLFCIRSRCTTRSSMCSVRVGAGDTRAAEAETGPHPGREPGPAAPAPVLVSGPQLPLPFLPMFPSPFPLSLFPSSSSFSSPLKSPAPTPAKLTVPIVGGLWLPVTPARSAGAGVHRWSLLDPREAAAPGRPGRGGCPAEGPSLAPQCPPPLHGAGPPS